MKKIKNISCAILAGGKNSRFNGFNKAFINIHGEPLIQKYLQLLNGIFDDIIIISNSPELYKDLDNINIFSDEYKNIGPLGGIHVALKNCKNESCFIIACDMPNISEDSIRFFIDKFISEKRDVLIPIKQNEIEPLHAIYSKKILSSLVKFIESTTFYKIKKFINQQDVQYIEIPDKFLNTFTNVNYPDDLQKIKDYNKNTNQDMQAQLNKIFANFKGSPEELIPLLQAVQVKFGFLSEESMKAISKFTKVPLSKIYGVATFYAQFRFKPKGKNHIMVCRGTACHVKGAPRILDELETQLKIKEGETTENLEYSIESVACIGACSLAPCIMINDGVEANLTPQKVKELFIKK